VSNFTIRDLEKLAKSGLTVPTVNQVYTPVFPPWGAELNTHRSGYTPTITRKTNLF
jgi:diketogulonate reductase-like aldo/keto reductase